jgi:hypothetical protein
MNMRGLRQSPVRTVGFVLALAFVSAFICVRVLADGQLSALPNVGASQTYNASENAPVGPWSQSGTLTIARVAEDSLHVSATNGLAALDQTLSVDPKGSVAQPSPPSPFIDLLDYVAAILAAAPPNVQKGAQWNVNVSALSPEDTARESGVAAHGYTKHLKPFDIRMTLTITLASVSGDVMTFHGQGTVKQETATIAGASGEDIYNTIDFELKSGQLQSCTRTTQVANIALGQPMGTVSYVTSLMAK